MTEVTATTLDHLVNLVHGIQSYYPITMKEYTICQAIVWGVRTCRFGQYHEADLVQLSAYSDSIHLERFITRAARAWDGNGYMGGALRTIRSWLDQ